MFALHDESTALQQLSAYAHEVARLTASGGYFVMVTAWTEDRRIQRQPLFAPLELVGTTVVHRHGPAAEHVLVMRCPPVVH